MGEAVDTYSSAVWELASTFKFGKFADQMLRDQLVEKTTSSKGRECLFHGAEGYPCQSDRNRDERRASSVWSARCLVKVNPFSTSQIKDTKSSKFEIKTCISLCIWRASRQLVGLWSCPSYLPQDLQRERTFCLERTSVRYAEDPSLSTNSTATATSTAKTDQPTSITDSPCV